jgi:D-serine deaminase-like pyridoxal phosphate-dependent protein
VVPVTTESEASLDWRWKGFPAARAGGVAQLIADQRSLFDAGFSWPVMALRDSAIDHNVAVMARWCADRGISLAPHGKTTMCPDLFGRQLHAGAWAMTAATPWQVRAYREFAVPRILVANEVVDVAFVSWVAAELEGDPEFDVLCYVDSVAGVHLLGEAMGADVRRPLQVLVEVGLHGGRTGCRSESDVTAVASAVADYRALSLVGVAGYEGPLGHERDDATLVAVDHYVRRLAATLVQLDAAGLFDVRATELVLTCGGSGHVDVVSAVLAETLSCSRPVRPVLRAGSYITHDHGLYERTSSMADELRAAIEVWCQVLSRPEPGLALLGAGRRDVSFDSGLPIPLWRRSAATGELSPLRATVSALNDQHAFLDLETGSELEVGDLVCLGISHPCTTFDKWQLIVLLDDDRRVTDCLSTYF